MRDEPEGSIGGLPGRAGTPAIVASLALISAMALWSGAAHAQSGPFVYVPNFVGNNVSRLDIPSGVLAPGAIGVGIEPYAVAVRGDQSLVYVANYGDGIVSVVDTGTNAVVASIAVGGSPLGLAISADGTRVYVANDISNTISVIDTASNTVTATVNINSPSFDVALSPDGTLAYATNSSTTVGSFTVSVIDTATNAMTGTITVGAGAAGVVFSPDGAQAYVTNDSGNSVSVIDTATNTVTDTIAVGIFPQSVAFRPDGTLAYVVNAGSNTVSVIDTATNDVTATIEVGDVPVGVAISPDGARAYVTNQGANTVSIIDTANNSVIGTIAGFFEPGYPGVCGNGNALLAAGRTFNANNGGAIDCTMTGPGTGPVFSGGTMQITGAGVSSALPVFLGPGGGTVDTQANSATFSGIISGPGSLTKIGTGTLILSGDSSYFGPTSVGGGTLVVNGSIAASVVTVNPGAVLRGDGIVGGLSLAGTLAPGNSIGTLHVFGNATFAAGSTYEVEINAAGQSDLLAVTGTVTLSGGEVIVLDAPGSYNAGTVYTIVTAGGGVSGAFDGVTDSLPLLDAVLSYLPNSVILTLERNVQLIAALGITPNQKATGAGIDSLGGGVLETALANLGASDIPAALDLLSGEIHASAKSGFIEESRYLREAASGRLRAAFGAVGAKPLPVMAYGEAGPVAAEADAPLAMWGEALGAWGSFDGDGNAADFDRSTGGFFTGIDALVADDARLGLIGGYTYSSFDVDDRASSGSANSVHIGAYGGTQLGNLGLRAVAAYSWNFVDTSRTATFGGVAENLDASYDAGTAQVFGEAGYRIDTASASFEPFANVAYVNLHTDGFTETGGAAALAHQSDDTDQTFTTLGIRASTPLQLGDKEVKLSGMVGWRHAFNDITPEAAFNFAGGAPFVIAGTPIARDALALEVGLDVQIGPRSSLGIAYSGQIGDDAQDHSANATLTVSF